MTEELNFPMCTSTQARHGSKDQHGDEHRREHDLHLRSYSNTTRQQTHSAAPAVFVFCTLKRHFSPQSASPKQHRLSFNPHNMAPASIRSNSHYCRATHLGMPSLVFLGSASPAREMKLDGIDAAPSRSPTKCASTFGSSSGGMQEIG